MTRNKSRTFADAVRAETREVGLGNAVLWEIVRGAGVKAASKQRGV